MKFRMISTHKFCVTDALGLVADCLHRGPHFGFVRFLSQNSLHSKFFHSCSQPAVQNFCSFFSRSQRSKKFLSHLNEIRSVSTSGCLAGDQNLP